jgi:hypothetical protein
MKVVKGASGEVCGVFSAFGDAFLSIATSAARRPVVHMMTGFRQDCIHTRRPRRPQNQEVSAYISLREIIYFITWRELGRAGFDAISKRLSGSCLSLY